jgi:competence CoiA-like predicted nuclease
MAFFIAIRISDEKLVEIDDPYDEEERYQCCFCKTEMIVVRGSIKQYHFRHKVEHLDCFEKLSHIMSRYENYLKCVNHSEPQTENGME